jgi:hypothetical protein
MLTEEEQAKLDEERKISKQITKYLSLEPLLYTYTLEEEKRVRMGKAYMLICIEEFFESLDAQKNLSVALRKVAIAGKCKFEWEVKLRSGLRKKMATTFQDPTWGELFTFANKIFLEEGNPDHVFLDGYDLDERSGTYSFFFGS